VAFIRNRELLWVGGMLARIVYEDELAEVGRMWKEIVEGKDQVDQSRKWLVERCRHVMRFFSYSPSTPSAYVSRDMEHSFFTAHQAGNITLISSHGPLSSRRVRLPNPATVGFIKNVPVVPDEVVGNPMLAALKKRHLISEVSLDDITEELNQRALNIEEMTLCLKWWITRERAYPSGTAGRVLANAMIAVPASSVPGRAGSTDERIQPLGTIKTFLNPRFIPTNVPLSLTTLPYSLSKAFSPSELASVFGWTELSITQWLQYIYSAELTGSSAIVDTNALANPFFAEKVIHCQTLGRCLYMY
jgi:hypothetical protein